MVKRTIHSVTTQQQISHFSLSLSRIKHHRKPKKTQEPDEQVHHLQTLTELGHHKILQFSSNPNPNRIRSITETQNLLSISQKQVEFTKRKKKLSEIPTRNHHHQAHLRNSNEESSSTTTKSSWSRRIWGEEGKKGQIRSRSREEEEYEVHQKKNNRRIHNLLRSSHLRPKTQVSNSLSFSFHFFLRKSRVLASYMFCCYESK
jgi:hypothetical protein